MEQVKPNVSQLFCNILKQVIKIYFSIISRPTQKLMYILLSICSPQGCQNSKVLEKKRRKMLPVPATFHHSSATFFDNLEFTLSQCLKKPLP